MGHDLVYGEIFIGDRGGRVKFLAEYDRIRRSDLVPHQHVVDLVRAHKLHGRGVGWIDIHLLASALASRSRLWTVDPRLAVLVQELAVDYTSLAR